MRKTILLSLGVSFSSAIGASVLQQHQRLAGFEAWAIPLQEVVAETAPRLPSVELEPDQEQKTQPEIRSQEDGTQPEVKPQRYAAQFEQPPSETVINLPPPAVPAVQPVLAPFQVNRAALKQTQAELLLFEGTMKETGRSMAVLELVRKALLWHPSVRQARSQVLASQEQVEAALAGYYPQISTGISGGYRDSRGSGNEALNVTAKQMLYDFGKVSSTVRAAEHGVNQEQARLLQSVDQLIEKTSLASLEVMRTQEKQAVAQEQLIALEEIWYLAKERAELGASAQSDVIQTLSRKEGAIAAIWELKAQADIWMKELQSLTGESQTIQVEADLPTGLGQQCTSQVLDLERVPSIRIIDEERSAVLARLDLTTAEMYPTLSVDAGYDQYLRSRDNWVNGRMQNRRSDYSVMLNMSVSVYEGGSKVAKRNAAAHQLQAIESEKESVILETTRGFDEAQTKQLILRQRLHSLKDRIESIQLTQDLYKDQYIALGTRSLLDLLNTEQELFHARSDYIDNKYDMLKAQIACLYYSGQLRNAFEVATMRLGGNQ